MKINYSKQYKIKVVLFYIIMVIILLLCMKEAMWKHKLDIEYKQAIIELKEREDLKL